MKIALVHDWLNQRGGAEDVLEALVEIFPGAPIYTSLYDPAVMPTFYRDWDIRPLWLDRAPGIHTHHQQYLPLYPAAWGGLDLSDYDVVLSNKSGFCHGFRKGPNTLHICYCLAPTRYVWQLDSYLAREGIGGPMKAGLKAITPPLRRWDYAAAQRVDRFIAISTEIQRRIQTYYERTSDLIYPPVDCARFQPGDEVGDYFLVLSRLIPYKRIDLAVQAATRLNVPLKVGGKGRDLDRLRALAGPTVEFLGFVPDADVPGLMAGCRAFLFPGLEDFGITPVQAQAAGRPVLAFRGGGALDTVIPGRTGELFDAQSVDSLAGVMATFDPAAYDPAALRAHALQFDKPAFAQQIRAYVEQAWNEFSAGRREKTVKPNTKNTKDAKITKGIENSTFVAFVVLRVLCVAFQAYFHARPAMCGLTIGASIRKAVISTLVKPTARMDAARSRSGWQPSATTLHSGQIRRCQRRNPLPGGPATCSTKQKTPPGRNTRSTSA